MSIESHDWLHHLREVRRLSEATIRSYRRDMAAWTAFLSERGMKDADAGVPEARSFMARMSARHIAPATVNRRLSALKGYYEWRRRREPEIRNPFAELRGVKKGRRLPGCLTHEELEAFIDAAGSDFAGLRDRVLFELLYSTGCRVGELCALNIEDVRHRRVRVKGKGSRERLVFIGDKAAEALADYLPSRMQRSSGAGLETPGKTPGETPGETPDEERALILDLRGRRLTPRGVYYLIRRFAVITGCAKAVSPHSFRHSFATHLLDEGADIRGVQEMLGHASLSTTQIYTHTGIERIKQVYRQSHPHAGRKTTRETAQGGNNA